MKTSFTGVVGKDEGHQHMTKTTLHTESGLTHFPCVHTTSGLSQNGFDPDRSQSTSRGGFDPDQSGL